MMDAAASGITVRFYEELNDYLPRAMRKRDIERPLGEGQTVKHVIEALGVPHTEVDLILVNGQSADFAYRPAPGDRISVYPVFESLPIQGLTRLHERPLRDPRFLCDVHLWKLARRLRLLGFDTAFDPHADDADLAARAKRVARILLTCDRGLLMRRTVDRGILVKHAPADEQLRQILARLDLYGECRPFTRCTMCNGTLEEISKDSDQFETLRGQIPGGVLEWCREYYRCLGCGKAYWPGAHCANLERIVDAALSGRGR